MNIFYFIYLTCIPSFVWLQGIDFPSASFPACVRNLGKNGWCRDIKDCPPVLDNILSNNYKRSNCGFRGNRPLVCCPLSVDLLTSNQENGVVYLSKTVTPPIISFECGKRPAVKSEYHPTSSREGTSNYTSTSFTAETSALPATFHAPTPWMVLLWKNDEKVGKNFFCNGVFINENYVLTAAQCVVNLESNTFFVQFVEGELFNSRESNEEPLEKFEDIKIDHAIIHPNYKPDKNYYNIALLKLTKTLVIRDRIVPICLPWGIESQEDLTNETVTIVGWAKEHVDGQPFLVQLEENATILDPSACNESYSEFDDYKKSFPEGMNKETILCTDNGTKDFCQVLAGGPVMYYGQRDDTFTLVGIISTDFGCRLKNLTRICSSIMNRSTLKWIKDVAFK